MTTCPICSRRLRPIGANFGRMSWGQSVRPHENSQACMRTPAALPLSRSTSDMSPFSFPVPFWITGRYVTLKDHKYSVAIQACIPADVMRSFVVYNNNDRDVLRGLINSVAKGSALVLAQRVARNACTLIDRLCNCALHIVNQLGTARLHVL